MKNAFIIIFLVFSSIASATDYYISSSGNDTNNNGLSSSTPWKTIAKVNSAFSIMKPGDRILFNRGDRYYGTITIAKSGRAGSPIVIGAYGTGVNPIISELTTLSSWTNNGGGVYYATLDVPRLNIVTLDGVVKGMGRYPDAGYLHYESHNAKVSITDDQLTGSPNWVGAEIGIRKYRWIIDRHVVTDHTNKTITYNSLGDYGNNTYYIPRDNNGYFFQNSINCLNDLGDWCYDAAANRLYMHFGGGVPGSYVIKAGSADRNLTVNSQNYIDFVNLDFEGANLNGVYFVGSTHINITDCNFVSQGGNAIYGISSDYIIITGGSITDALNDGIFFEKDVDNVTIDGLVVTNAGNILGASRSGDGAALGMQINGNNSIVRNCRISNIGYCGIYFSGNDCLIEHNYVDTTCLFKDDGGGIYTLGAEYTGRIIRNNIVLNSIGSYAGAESEYWEPWGKACGIYLDNYSANVEVSGNTIANCSWSGIFINGGASNNILNNTLYNCIYQFQIWSGADHLVRNTIVTGNKFISKTTTQLCYYLNSTVDENPSAIGDFDYNYYARPIDDSLTIQTVVGNDSSTNHTLAGWKTLTNQDANSHKSPITITNINDIRFEYNASKINKVIALDQPMIDVKGKKYAKSINLLPYRSAVLIVDPNPGSGYIEETNILIYPNPARDFFNISIEELTLEPVIIRIIDFSGRIVFEDSFEPGIDNIQIHNNLVPGVYIVKLRSGNVTLDAQKLIINRP